jgi:hypothetical protein
MLSGPKPASKALTASFSASGDCWAKLLGTESAEAATGTDGTALAVSRAAHKTVKAIGEDIEKLAFNKAVARLYELVNTLAAPLSDVASGKADAESEVSLQAGFQHDRAADRADDAASGGRMLEIARQ